MMKTGRKKKQITRSVTLQATFTPEEEAEIIKKKFPLTRSTYVRNAVLYYLKTNIK